MGSVKSLSPNHRLVIALHSPGGVVETGLPMCPPEKKARKLAWGSEAGHFLQSGLSATSEELRAISCDFQIYAAEFLCTPDCVAEEKDSNPRYPFGYSGFQVHRRVLIGLENSLLYLISQQLTNPDLFHRS